MARELILKLGKKITDRVDVKLGMTKLDENSPEYYGLASVVTDEMAELALAMKVRVPTTPAEIGKKVGKDPVYVEQLFDQMSMIGLLEYNWENAADLRARFCGADEHEPAAGRDAPGDRAVFRAHVVSAADEDHLHGASRRRRRRHARHPGREGHPGHERVGRCRAHLPLAEKV